MEKIDIIKILKDCPKGIKLYSPIFGEVRLFKIVNNHIEIDAGNNFIATFAQNGRYYDYDDWPDAECLLFPSKENRDWSTFQKPFNDGEIAATDSGTIFIVKNSYTDDIYYHCYCGLYNTKFIKEEIPFAYKKYCRLATEVEKQKLFNAIKANGYKWNAETKTLKKLIEPKFKVGDRIKRKGYYMSGIIINSDIDNFYKIEYDNKSVSYINVENQDNWELTIDKFDISTLKPFESKVLVRGSDVNTWIPAIFGIYEENCNTKSFYAVGGTCWFQCIPYEGNEHLLGTTNDCDEYYKIWKK